MKLLRIFLLLLIISSCSKEEITVNNSAEFEAFLDEEMDIERIPALSVLLFRGDSILYESYKGKASREQDIKLEPEHVFLMASVSKVVTATAFLQLYDAGLVDLYDPINNYLPFQVNHPDHNTPITFSMLLTHTSGIADGPSMDDEYYYGMDSPKALGTFMQAYFTPSGSDYSANDNFYGFEPGTKHEYTNMGNALLGYLVEVISGQDFNQYCKENIFQPLDMEHTFWRLDEVTQTIIQPYRSKGKGYQLIEHYTFTDYPNGGLRTTARDLHRFFNAFLNDGISNNYPLLQPATIAMMSEPQIPNIDPEVGLHLFLMDKDYELWGHDGGEEGVATVVLFNKTNKTGLVVLCNQGDANLEYIVGVAYDWALRL